MKNFQKKKKRKVDDGPQKEDAHNLYTQLYGQESELAICQASVL